MLVLVGAGPGNIKLLTQEAIEEIEKAESVIAFGRITNSIKKIRKNIDSIKSVAEVNKVINSNEYTVLLASGDPCFFGINDYLIKQSIVVDKIIPGISSMQYLAAKIKKTWAGFCFYSGHGRIIEYTQIKSNKQSFVFTDNANNPNEISKQLCGIGMKGKMFIGFNLSYNDEKIVKCNIGDEIEILSKLSVVLIENDEY